MNRFGFNISMRNTPEEIEELGEKCLKDGGFQAIEVTYYENMEGVDTFAYNQAIRRLVDAYHPQVTVHISGFNTSQENMTVRSALLNEFVNCCQYTMNLGGREVIMHAGRAYGALHVPVIGPKGQKAASGVREQRVWALSVDFFKKACAIAKLYGITVYTENLNCDHITVRCAQVRKFVEDVGADNLKIVFDIGHCHHTGGNIVEDVLAAGDLLRHLHLHDNFGKRDEHLPCGEGNIDYQSFCDALKKINYAGLYMMELNYCTPQNVQSSKERILQCL